LLLGPGRRGDSRIAHSSRNAKPVLPALTRRPHRSAPVREARGRFRGRCCLRSGQAATPTPRQAAPSGAGWVGSHGAVSHSPLSKTHRTVSVAIGHRTEC
jgi:hypothetical protein